MAAPGLTIRQMLHPQSVAVIGASDTEDKWGGRVMLHLRKHGFTGRIIPVNARRSEVLGLAAYPHIKAVPHPVDVAVVAVPPDRAVDAVDGCASCADAIAGIAAGGLGADPALRRQAHQRGSQQNTRHRVTSFTSSSVPSTPSARRR